VAALVSMLLAVCVASVVAVVAQQRRITSLRRALDDAVGAEATEVITIEIRNHAELAASRSAFARPLAVLTPGLLRGIVHRETLKMMRVEMAENGVDADVRLRRLGSRAPDQPVPPEALDG
jgi:hypothetical protein